MTDDDKRELELAIMNAQLENIKIESDKLRAEAERFRQEMKWEPYKAFAVVAGGILGASAVMLTAVLALASWMSAHHVFG
jgi:hypothetical protein